MSRGAGSLRSGIPRALPLVAGAIAAALVLTGCGSVEEPVTSDPSARAMLDQDTGEIILPLSEYDLIDSSRDMALFNYALDIYIGECMSKQGLSYSASSIASDLDRLVDDRTYGIWYEPTAREYGFGFAPSEVDEAIAGDVAVGGESWVDAQLACSAEAESDAELSKFMPTNAIINESLVSTIRTDAYRLASADPLWQNEREKWWECLRDAGLDPLTGATDWGTKQDLGITISDDGRAVYSEESIRVAFLQAECNNSTGLTQNLGNLEASYQAPMIDKNQAALNTWKEDKQTKLDAAVEFITRHG